MFAIITLAALTLFMWAVAVWATHEEDAERAGGEDTEQPRGPEENRQHTEETAAHQPAA
jgi:hypothetical protein